MLQHNVTLTAVRAVRRWRPATAFFTFALEPSTNAGYASAGMLPPVSYAAAAPEVSMKNYKLLLIVVLAASAAVSAAGAQLQTSRRELVGLVRDPNGNPIEGATVEVSAGTSARTNAKGAFQLWTPGIDTVTINIKRLGFSPVEAMISARNRQWDTVMVELERNSQRLVGVNVTEEKTRGALALSTLPDRIRVGLGQFVTREDIVARNTAKSSDLMQLKRGIKVVRLAGGRNGVRFVSYTNKGNCAPDFWLDGVRARGMELDDILASDIEAIELYESFASLPHQFTPSGAAVPCGTIVVWTRVPDKRDKPTKP